MASLLLQWARRYLEVAYPPYSLPKRARIRAFYSEGVENLYVPWIVQALTALLHISLFLFFAGLAVFLFNVHLTIFEVVTAWIGIASSCTHALPSCRLFARTAHTPDPCVTGIRHVFFKLFDKSRRNAGSAIHPVHFFSRSMPPYARGCRVLRQETPPQD